MHEIRCIQSRISSLSQGAQYQGQPGAGSPPKVGCSAAPYASSGHERRCLATQPRLQPGHPNRKQPERPININKQHVTCTTCPKTTKKQWKIQLFRSISGHFKAPKASQTQWQALPQLSRQLAPLLGELSQVVAGPGHGGCLQASDP